MSISRKECREALATLLTNSVPAAQAVYPYKIGDIQGQSPVLSVLGAGTQRVGYTFQGTRPTYWLEIHVFVLDAIAAQSWTEQNVEDTLDQVEEEIGQALATNRRTEIWSAIDYDGRSTIRDVAIGGTPYMEETIPVRVEVAG